MKLDVLIHSTPWYSNGLNFTCTQCGNCCTGGPGFVWISPQEITRLAQLLGLTEQETTDQYCRDIGGRMSLREVQNSRGEHDCIFLTDAPGGKRVCRVYDARPRQCRDWPFWEGNLASREAWDRAGLRCHGINQGKLYPVAEIDAARHGA